MSESVLDAVNEGSELQILYAARRVVAENIDICENPHDLSSLTAKLVDICERITELEKQQKPKRKTALESVRTMRK